jgi:CRP-like cAMP-binding protein/predicted MFS family arabinose efflux permease
MGDGSTSEPLADGVASVAPRAGATDVDEVATRRRGARPVLRRNPGFGALLTSTVVSEIGDYLYTIALYAYLLPRPDGVAWVTALTVVRIVPRVVLGPLGGALADRFDRRRLMVTLDLVRLAIMAVLAIVVAADGPPLAAVALAFASAAASAPYLPAAAAATPHIVREDDLATANALRSSIAQLTFFAGPALGALLLEVVSTSVSVVVNGGTFLVAAILISTVRAAGGAAPSRAAPEGAAADAAEGAAQGAADDGPRRGVVGDVVVGWRALRGDADVMALFGLVVVFQFAVGVEAVLYALVADRRLDLGANGLGYLFGAIGVGGLLASVWAGRVADSRRAGWGLPAAAVCTGAALALLGGISVVELALLVLLVEGVGNVLFDVVTETMLQRLVPGELLGRAFGLFVGVAFLATLVGSLVAGPLESALGLSTALAVCGGITIVGGLVLMPRLLAASVRASDRAAALGPRVARLGALGLFDGLDRAALERVAAAVRVEAVPAGTAVVREGDPADDLYVVEAGEFAVHSTGGAGPGSGPGADGGIAVRPGGWFGEIGLIERVPRTATVTARTEAVVWRIPGAAFLDAVQGLPDLPAPLRAGVHTRLARTHGARKE